MGAATVVQQLCKSCRTCSMFYCMFYYTCDRSLNVSETDLVWAEGPGRGQVALHRRRARSRRDRRHGRRGRVIVGRRSRRLSRQLSRTQQRRRERGRGRRGCLQIPLDRRRRRHLSLRAGCRRDRRYGRFPFRRWFHFRDGGLVGCRHCVDRACRSGRTLHHRRNKR